MKIIPSSRRRHYLARFSIFLITVALIAGMVGCGPVQYNLTIFSSEGGEVTTPGEETFTYEEGAVVNLVAEADEGYQFVNWTGDVNDIADVEDATTTITMNDHYSITANFELDEVWYSLTIASTYGGSVTTPSEGTSVYAANTTVNLVAEPDEHYHFVNWTGDVSTIADVEAATTNITMYDSYYIIANFEIDEGWYTLTISSIGSGSVTEPGEGISVHAANTTVNLVVQPDEGCRFVEWIGDVDTIADVNNATTTIIMGDNYYITAKFGWYDITQVAAGGWHTVGLRAGGTVVAVGDNYNGQCDVGGWTDITQVDANEQETAGLKTDGTVVYLGDRDCGQWDVGDWTDIIQVASGDLHTVGLKADGTVIAVGYNYSGQCDVGGWTDIIQISAGCLHTVGLKSDGTVVAVGHNDYGECNVSGWADITQVDAGAHHTVGLKSDDTVVAVGRNFEGQCNVGNWADIIQVSAGVEHTVGLKADGAVVAVGINEEGQCNIGDWTGIVQIAAGWYHTVGLKADGTVVAMGQTGNGQCDVG